MQEKKTTYRSSSYREQQHQTMTDFYTVDRKIRQLEAALHSKDALHSHNTYIQQLLELQPVWFDVSDNLPLNLRLIMTAWRHIRVEMPPCVSDQDVANQYDVLLWEQAYRSDDIEEFETEWTDDYLSVEVMFVVFDWDNSKEYDPEQSLNSWLSQVERKASDFFELDDCYMFECVSYAVVSLTLTRK